MGDICKKECLTKRRHAAWLRDHDPSEEYYCEYCDQETDSCRNGCVFIQYND